MIAIAIAVVVVAGIAAAAISAGGDDGETATDHSSTAASSTTESSDDSATTERPTTTESPTTTSPPGPPTLAMGAPLSFTLTDVNGNETAVEVVVGNPITADREPVEYGMEPTRGLFLVLDVNVRVTGGDGTYSASPYEFKFVAGDGTVSETTFVGTAFGPELPYSDLSAGQQIAGSIGFDIAPGQEVGGRIQINDSGENYGEPFAYWAL